MSTPYPPTDLGPFRSRILVVLGLTRLAACDAPIPVEATDGVDILAHASAGREAIAASPTLTLESDTVEANRLAIFRVTGAEPGSVVHFVYGRELGELCPDSLEGGCLDTPAPAWRIGVREANAFGVATIREPFPDLADGETVVGQALAVGAAGPIEYSEAYVETVAHPARTCADAPEADPSDPLVHRELRLVCEPRYHREACTQVDLISSWTAADMFENAVGHPLDADWMVRAICLETSITDECCYTMRTEWVDPYAGAYDDWVGRPFVVAGQALRARCETTAGWSELLDLDAATLPERLRERLEAHWSRLGLEEHASVASFSRFNLELVALGAPSELVAASTRAVADEIRHARVSFGVASVFAGAPVGPGPIAITGALDRSEDPEAVLVAAILEGCVNETICAVQARAAAEGARDPGLRELLRGIAADESRHAELSWAFVRWMLGRHPELREVAARAFDAFVLGPAPAPDPDRAALLAFGATTDDLDHEVAVAVLREVVRPCAALLLGRAVPAADPTARRRSSLGWPC